MIDLDERKRLWGLVEQTIDRWRQGESPNAAAFLAAHPEIGSRKTLALDLIHEELCLRKESGDTVVASTFVEQFPDYRSSIVKMLAVEQYGDEHPEFPQALGESLWPQVGQDYQGFEIVEPLGRGALARVYLARETAMGRRPVVVKVSQHGGHEAHLLGKLEHPNIVTAYSVRHDAATGMTVICMPLLGTATGLDLLDQAFRGDVNRSTAEVIGQVAGQYQPTGLVKEESLREAFPFAGRTYVEGAVWLAKELAAGLAAAGETGVAHRDIKPSNVLLAWSGRPMLLDFNLSSGEDLASDRVGGTLAYMAPERIATLLAGRAAAEEKVDPRPDIFSLGAVLYELLSGRLPVQPLDAEGSDEASLRRWLDGRSLPIEPPSRWNPAVDAQIDRIVLRCLAVEPDRRYATAADLQDELAAYLSPRQTAARWARRNRRALLVGGLAAAGAMFGGGAYWASLPPYHEWKYQEGLRLYVAEDYRGAAQALGRSLQAEPSSAKALFARGQSLYRLNNLAAAQKDFLAAAALEDRAVLWFCAGCCALQDQASAAYLAKAGELGWQEGEWRTNYGICLERESSKRAEREYAAAIAADPGLPQPYLERARLKLNEALARPRGSAERVAACRQGIADVEQSAALGRDSPRLYLLGARLHVLAAQGGEAAEPAVSYLERYLQRGGNQATLGDEMFRSLLTSHPQLREIESESDGAPNPEDPPGVSPPPSANLAEFDSVARTHPQ